MPLFLLPYRKPSIVENLNLCDIGTGSVAILFKQAVETLFKVKVTGVRTATVEGKERRRGKFAGYRPDWKKAYVRLKDGEKMPEYLNSL